MEGFRDRLVENLPTVSPKSLSCLSASTLAHLDVALPKINTVILQLVFACSP